MAELEVLDDDQSDESDVTETDDAEWAPPSRQDWDNVNLALKKARRDARAARRGTVSGTAEQLGGAPDVERVTREATSAVEARYKPMVVKAQARAAFAEAGLKGDSVARVVRLLDLDDLDIDDEGSVTGLNEQIEEIKQDFPELFAATANSTGTTRRTSRVDGANKPAGSTKPQSSAERIASMLG